MIKTSMVFFALLITAAVSVPVASADRQLKTVDFVDLERYKGKWYEIARYPNSFQEQCIGDVTATYSLLDAGGIEVVNECLTADGSTDRAVGEARVVDKNTNARLKVRFAPEWLSWLPLVWGDYRIIGLGPDYEYAVIGDRSREYLWVLSRTPELDPRFYNEIIKAMRDNGFKPGQLVKTPQGRAPGGR